jgi:hypothetical protein
MFLAIDRVSKFTYVEFRDDAGKMNGAVPPSVDETSVGSLRGDREG